MIEWLPLVLILVVLLIAAIPMTIAVKIMGGEASLMRVVFANILVWAVILLVKYLVPGVGGFATFIIMIFVYKVMFKMGWFKTIFAWLLQGVLAVLLVLVLAAFGFTLIAL